MRLTAVAGAALILAALFGAPAAGAQSSRPDRRVVLVLDHGRAQAIRDPYASPADELPPPRRAAHTRAAARAHAARRRGTKVTFAGELDRLAAAGQIDAATRDRGRRAYIAARHSLGILRGTRRDELGAVLANLAQLSADRGLTPSRLAAQVLTLERNRQWWTTGPLLASGQRVGFPASQLVWQYYPGQGIQIQWLGTFGRANGYFLSGHAHDGALAALLDESVSLATRRAGGIAWEYEFHFDGGAPPWVSGLAQGTAIQALSRAGIRLGRTDYLAAARGGLGIFRTAPPTGVRVATAAGAHYLIYSFAPQERVLNGFIQSLVGLHDFAALANDDTGRALFNAGDAEARLEVPRYDTGAWSLYDQATESDLSYHLLLRDFLAHLCERLRAPAKTAQSQGPSPQGSPLPAPAANIYCETADRFTLYVHQAPRLTPLPIARARATRGLRIGFVLSKISTVTLRARVGGRTIYTRSLVLAHGKRTLPWTPSKAGKYTISLGASDLAGNTAAVTEQLTVGPAPHHRGKRHKR